VSREDENGDVKIGVEREALAQLKKKGIMQTM